MAEVDPTCVSGLTSYGVTNLTALRESVSFEKVKFFKHYDNLYISMLPLLLLMIFICCKSICIDKIIFINNNLKRVQQKMKIEKSLWHNKVT